MRFSLAPMEEVTGYCFRNAHAAVYGKLDSYLTPFLVPTQKKIFKTKEMREINPANNKGLRVVPQLLTNKSEAFLYSGTYLKSLGYEEVNLNLGCPSGTVVPKGRGSGFLKDPEELDAFFREVFAGICALPEKDRFQVSVKTRLGLSSPEEFPELLRIYSSYPLSELIVHPRIQPDFYKGVPRLDSFALALSSYPGKLTYNGDIFTTQDLDRLLTTFPGIESIMIGRGLVARPGLVREVQTGKKDTREELYAFTTSLFREYLTCYGNEPNALGKMKEVWYYYEWRFPQEKSAIKKIKKANKKEAYEAAVDAFFLSLPSQLP